MHMMLRGITWFGVGLTLLASCGDETPPVINKDGGDLPALEICDDKKDNDDDGKTDCADPDCTYAPQCGGDLDLGLDRAEPDLSPKEDGRPRDDARGGDAKAGDRASRGWRWGASEPHRRAA